MKAKCWMVLAVVFLFGGNVAAPVGSAPQDKPALAAAARPVLEKKGYLVSAVTLVVVPEVSGRIVRLRFDEGTHVKQGELLAQLDDTVYALDYKRAEAQVARARARPRLPESPEDLAIAEAERDKAKYLLEQTKVYAPFAGTVLSKKAEAGAFIDRLHFNGYYALCELADLTKLEVDVAVDERDLHRVFAGQKCTVQPEAFPESVYEGRVARLAPIADRAKSSVPVRIRLALSTPEPKLRPEMGAVVRFLGKE